MKHSACNLVFLLAGTLGAVAAPFQNLGFDRANTGNLTPNLPPPLTDPHFNSGTGSLGDMLPGWQVLYGGVAWPFPVWLNSSPLGPGIVSIYDINNYYGNPTIHVPVEGLYSFGMFPDTGRPPTAFGLSQTGDVPADAKTLNFTSYGLGVEMYVNDALVPVNYTCRPNLVFEGVCVSSGEADVSMYAGQPVQLKFKTLTAFGVGGGVAGLDSIYFSPVPEPETLALFSVGLVALGVVRLRRARNARGRLSS